jgi:hypothetical protein
MPADGQNEPVLSGDDKQTAGVFKNSLRGWQARWKDLCPEGPGEPVVPMKLEPPRRKGRRAARPQ